jgi:hypothetical protein
MGHTVAQVVEARRYKSEGLGFRFSMMSLEFFIEIILPAALWPGVDSASNRNEYQKYILGVKATGV